MPVHDIALHHVPNISAMNVVIDKDVVHALSLLREIGVNDHRTGVVPEMLVHSRHTTERFHLEFFTVNPTVEFRVVRGRRRLDGKTLLLEMQAHQFLADIAL